MYASDIERLFKVMWEKFARGEKPDHIAEMTAEVAKKNIKIAQVEKMTEIGNFELMEINNKESSAAVTATTQINV
jgi:hypothetical protein